MIPLEAQLAKIILAGSLKLSEEVIEGLIIFAKDLREQRADDPGFITYYRTIMEQVEESHKDDPDWTGKDTAHTVIEAAKYRLKELGRDVATSTLNTLNEVLLKRKRGLLGLIELGVVKTDEK